MNKITGILISLTSILLVTCLLIPSLAKFAHARNEHHSEECTDANRLHVHEAELDCDFQKFQLSPQFTQFTITFNQYKHALIKKGITNFYFFLSKYQKLQFILRGPPYLS
ncbi:hypothetical protein [Zobellia nedashkovskayae]|uniref:hypothetical protein n=1 Tax=Zobellia nedashkovskayae TaxID=2779510 RepID=UPI00188C7117|nr:hypothetical protein [Zobellia nedashkovskayae]